MATISTLGFSIISRYSGGGVASARRDLASLRAQLATINGDLQRHTSFLSGIPSRWKAIGVAAASIAPALIPISAAALQVAASFTVMATAVGASLGAYGAAMAGAIRQTMEMAKAGKALSPVQKEFVGSVNAMKKAWTDFIGETSNKTLATATNVVQGLTAGIKLLKPLIDAIHPSLLRVSQDFENWMKGDRAREYSKLLADIARVVMPNLIAAGKAVLNVLGDGFRAFAPLAEATSQSIRRGAEALKSWSDGGGFQRFLAYVKESGPAVAAFWQSFRDALRNVFNILKEFSSGSLSVLTDALRGIAAINPESVKAFANALLLIKAPLLWLVLNCPPLRDAMVALLGALNPATIYAIAGAFVALRIATVAFGVSLLTTPVGWVITALAGLAVAITMIATKTTWFQTAWTYTWNFIKTVGLAVWHGLQAAWTAVTGALIGAWNAVSGALTAAWNAVWGAISLAATTIWNALKTAWQAVTGWFASVWQSSGLAAAWTTAWTAISLVVTTIWNTLKEAWNLFVTALTTIWNAVSGPLAAAWNLIWTGISTVAQGIWTALSAAWGVFINGLATIWSTVSAVVSAAWQVFWTTLQTVAQAVWTAMQAAWQLFITTIQTIWTTMSAIVGAAWQVFWTTLQTVAQAIWTAMQAAWQLFITTLQTIWTTVSVIITAAWNLFWNNLKLVATTIWTALQTAWQLLWTTVQTVWTTFVAVLQAAWTAFWTALQTAATTIWTALQTAWQTFVDAIKAAYEAFSSFFTEAWTAFWNGVKEAATSIWDSIKSAVADGVNGCIDIINGIIGAWNTITGAIGLDGLNIDTIGHVSFAVGGVVGDMPHFAAGGTVNFSKGGGALSGYAPGRDTVPAILSRGEGVLTPEAMRGIGGAGVLNSLNRKFAGHRGAGRGAAPLPFAVGGAVSLGGGAQAWHRSGGETGWAFALGGLPSEIPVPDPDGPGGPSTGGGTMGQKPKQQENDGGGILDSLGPAGDLIGMVLGFIGEGAIRAAFAVAGGAIDAFGGFGVFGDILKGMMNKLKEGMIENLIKRDSEAKTEYESMSVAGAQSVQAWAPLAAKALQMAGLAPGQLQAFLALMSAESGGNPNAINNWDINASNGVPSQGLMQVIPPTFAANHVAGTSNNILDPLANMAASARYIKNRYGGIVPGSPYANGTPGATRGIHLVGEQGPELMNFAGGETITPAGETSSIIADAATAGMGGAATAAPMAAPSLGGSMGGMTGGGSASSVTTPEGVMALVQQLLEAAQQLKAEMTAMWSQVVATTNTSWSSVYGTTFTPMNASLSGTIPAGMETMRAAWTTGMTGITTDTTTQWAALNTSAFTPMNAMMSTSVPEAANVMNEGVTTASTEMQTGVQGSWDGMAAGTQSSWDSIYQSIDTSVQSATTPINGLLGGFNNVSSALGMGINVPLIAFELGGVAGFSTGGMLAKNGGAVPGYSPGRDTFPAMLSPGEGVLTPEAVRGLGGPGFVFAANRKFSGHRGGGGSTSEKLSSYMGDGSHTGCGHYATGGMAGVSRNGVQHFMSGSITAQDAEGLAEAGLSGESITQGSFSTGVAASAGTHDGDGVLDFSSTSVQDRARAGGWAAWTRGNGDGMSPHTHAVYMKATGIAPGAQGQVLDYINGGSGLGVGAASDAELAQWGLGLGRWDFGPLLQSIIGGSITTVPPLLKPLVLKKLTSEQVTSGFSGLKAALDGTDMGTGMFADGLMGIGNKTHEGIVNSITSQVGAASFDEGGLLQPGYTLAFNGTGKPEPVGHDLEPRGSRGVEISMPITITGNADAQEVVDGINSQVLPKLRQMLSKGTGTNS